MTCCIIPYNHTMQAVTVFSVCWHAVGTFRACAGVRRRSRACACSRGRAEGGSGLPPLAYRRSEFFIKTFGSFRLPLISSSSFQHALTRSADWLQLVLLICRGLLSTCTYKGLRLVIADCDGFREAEGACVSAYALRNFFCCCR